MSDLTLQPEETQQKGNRFTSEVFLGSLVAILSILTAVAAYQGAILDAQAGDYELRGMKALTESNTEYIFANQEIIYDYRLYDNYFLNENEEADEYYTDSFSEALTASIERAEGPFDEAYYDAQFDEANVLYAEAIDLFDKTDKTGGRADGLQMVMLVFALGLSFAAWASLADEGGKTRTIFTVLAIIATIIGLGLYASQLMA